MTDTSSRGGTEPSDIRFRSALDHLLAGRTHAHMRFQPIVDLRRGTIAGYEALIRFPSPPDFAPDFWFRSARLRGKRVALEHLAAMMALEARSLLPPQAFLSVNVGPVYLMSDEFTKWLRAAERLDRMVIEITEGDHIEDYSAVRRRLDAVRKLGGSIAVDDTGSGYASLKHVMELRPQFVKLDRFFIQDCHNEPVKAEMIHMIGEAADRLDAWVIAEGIETDRELNEVVRRDVPLGQGYFLGRPQEEMAQKISPESLRVLQFRQQGVAGVGLWSLVESVQVCASLAEAEAAVQCGGRTCNAVVLDAHDRPQLLVEFHPVLGVRALPSLMRVSVSSRVPDVLRRALARPIACRFDPLNVTGETGEFLGVVRMDHLMTDVLGQAAFATTP